jgi:Cupin superfamily (DUF985)
MPSAAEVIRLLDLKPHPEGGHYRQTFATPARWTGRARSRPRSTICSARARRALALAQGRRGRRLALSRWRATRARDCAGCTRSGRTPDAGSRSPRRPTAPGDRAGSRLAGGAEPGRMHAAQLHGGAGLRVRALRARAAGLGAVAGLKADPCTQMKYWPPFAVSVEPVMSPASSDARNTTQRAISSGSPSRPIGISGRTFFSSTSFGIAFTMSVAI